MLVIMPMSDHTMLKKLKVGNKIAEIASETVGYPYAARLSKEEGIVWEGYANDRLYHRAFREKYRRKYDLALAMQKKVQKEIGMNFDLSRSIEKIRYNKNGIVEFESTIMLDLAWSIENDDFPIPEKVIPQLDDPKNWPKWKKKMPITMTMLEKCHDAAKEVSARSGTNIVITREGHSGTSDEYVFKTSFDAKDMTEEKFFKEVERHCKAMVKAYKKYEPCLTGSEYEKLINMRE